MIDLLKYYENISNERETFSFRYEEEIQENKKYLKEKDCIYYNDLEIINKFKELIQPKNNVEYTEIENKILFFLICFYLDNEGYYIKQFPDSLKAPESLEKFAYNKIKVYIETKKTDKKVFEVTWSERRQLISNLEFIKKKSMDFVEMNKKLKEIIKDISLGNREFENLSIDEKIEILNNLIENLLKKENEFYYKLDINENFSNFLTINIIKEYRKTTQCFRHFSDNSITERNAYKPEEKIFLVNYGITICNYISFLINK